MVRATARNYNGGNSRTARHREIVPLSIAGMQIHIARDGQKLGPFSTEEVTARLAAGELRPTDLAWAEGRAEWCPLSAFPGFSSAPGTPPPLRAPVAPPPLQRIPGGDVMSTSGLAIASLTCGILSCVFLPVLASIPAIVCGHMSLSEIKRSAGAIGGKGIAMTGTVMGYLTLAILPVIAVIAILAGIALPVFSQVQLKGKQVKSLSQAKQIAIACHLYADDHDGAFPVTIEELVPEILPDRSVFICPLSGPSEPMGYIYYGGKETDPGENVLIVSKGADRRGKRIVVHVDGSGTIEQYTPGPLPLR